MNLPRSSIVRLMASIGMIAAALALLRVESKEEYWLGELVPPSAIGLLGLAIALITSGRVRRFSVGLAATGVVVGLTFWASPYSFRCSVLKRVIWPIDMRFVPHPAFIDQIEYYSWPLSTDARGEIPNIRMVRSPFWSRTAQKELGLLELLVAVVGGLVAAIARPKWPDRTSLPMLDSP